MAISFWRKSKPASCQERENAEPYERLTFSIDLRLSYPELFGHDVPRETVVEDVAYTMTCHSGAVELCSTDGVTLNYLYHAYGQKGYAAELGPGKTDTELRLLIEPRPAFTS